MNALPDKLSGHSTEFDVENVSWLICLNAHNTRPLLDEWIDRTWRNEAPRRRILTDAIATRPSIMEHRIRVDTVQPIVVPFFANLRSFTFHRCFPRQQSFDIDLCTVFIHICDPWDFHNFRFPRFCTVAAANFANKTIASNYYQALQV